MSRRKPEVPSLADALAKGFADIKKDDTNPSPVEEIPQVPEVLGVPETPESTDIELPSKPQYGRPAQHRAEESSFIVNANTPTQASENGEETSGNNEETTEKTESQTVEVLEKPSSTLGDDFDVEW